MTDNQKISVAKAYLNQLRNEAQNLQSLKDHIEELRYRLSKPGNAYGERVSGGKHVDFIASGTAQLVDLEYKLQDKALRYEIQRSKLLDKVLQLNDTEAARINVLFYIFFKDIGIDRTAAALGYSRQHVFRLQNAALIMFYDSWLANETDDSIPHKA